MLQVHASDCGVLSSGRPPKRAGLLTVALLAAAPLAAQSAGISGLITDPSGRVLTTARITVRSESSGATRDAAPNQLGLYSIPALPPGAYEITI